MLRGAKYVSVRLNPSETWVSKSNESMNPIKLITPDFFIGKSLMVLKTAVDLLIMIAKSPSLPTLRLAKLIWIVKPNFTMVKCKNLINLHNLVKTAN